MATQAQDVKQIGQPLGAMFLQGNFAPVTVETTAFDLPVTGKMPPELDGRLVRIGPNPVGEVDPMTYHLFFGPGMAHGVRLRGGKAEWYRNRHVVTDAIAPLLGRAPLSGPRNGTVSDTVNTNILEFGGKTYALVEAGGLPVELTYELECVARSNFGGTLKHGYSAHPKQDPVTREWHALTYQSDLDNVGYVIVGTDGKARTAAEIYLPHGPMLHDVTMTATRIIIPDLPVIRDTSIHGAMPYAWSDSQPSRIGLLPRDGTAEDIQWFEAPRCQVFHFMNSYDDGDDVVIDVSRHHRAFERQPSGPPRDPILERWVLNVKTGMLTETIIYNKGCEFPRFNETLTGLKYRFGYTNALVSGAFGGLQKHDMTTGETWERVYDGGRVSLEPVFVPRENAKSEDDGYIMSYVYDPGRHATDIEILDAQDFLGTPIAKVALPVRVPFGFHGNWISGGED